MRHPTQPIYTGQDGITQFKANPIVAFLLNAGPFDLNMISMMPWELEDRVQLAQLLGYSTGGFAELPYLTDDEYIRAVVPDGASLIAQERERHQEQWSHAHDDQHPDGALTAAAICYLCPGLFETIWPFRPEDWKPGTVRENLVKAGSLIAAEIDKIDRAAGETKDG